MKEEILNMIDCLPEKPFVEENVYLLGKIIKEELHGLKKLGQNS